jgi:hypothetical protein
LILGGLDGARLADSSPYDGTEIFAAAIGGVLGSRIPDAVDPPHGPRHRAAAHDVMIGVAVAGLPIAEWQAACRAQATQHAAHASAHPADSWERWFQELLAWLWHVVAGLLTGLRAGFLSHLILDAFTTLSVPVMGM